MVLGSKVKLALDYSDINRDAKRYGGPATPGLDYVSAYRYPGVERDEWLLSAVSEFNFATAQK